MSETDAQKHERAELVAEKIKVLFMFCMDIAADKDLIEAVREQAQQEQSRALSMAPILGAVGLDYEEAELEAGVHARRAAALLNLIDTLQETEYDRIDFKKKQASTAEARAKIARMVGL